MLTRRAVPTAVAMAIVAILAFGVQLDVVRIRYALAASALLLAFSIVLTARNRRGMPADRTDFLLPVSAFAAGILLDAVNAVNAWFGPVGSRADALFQFTSDLAIWTMLWTMYFLVVGTEVSTVRDAPVGAERGDGRIDRRLMALIVFGGALLILATAHWLTHGRSPAMVDEMLYVFQARLLGEPGFSRPLNASVAPFFVVMQSVFRDGRLFTQYPPGWPVVLALFDRVGAIDWAGSVIGAAAVLLTFLLGRQLYSTRVGLIAAALMLFHPLVIEAENNYWSHSGSTVCLLIAAYLALGATPVQRDDTRRWLLVGISLGMACAIRPFTGVTAGLTVALWYLLRTRPAPRQLLRVAGLVLLGAMLPAAGVAYYNHETSGHALRFGYSAGNGSLQSLGFGRRGLILLDGNGDPNVVATNFTATVALAHLARRVWELVLHLLPSALLVPILLLAQRYGYPWKWSVVLAFLILPLGYAFWYFDAGRFYVDLFPFLFIGVARLLEHIGRVRPRLVVAIAVYLLVAAPLAAATSVRQARGGYRICRESDASLRAFAPGDSLLVFVVEDSSYRGRTEQFLLSCLYSFNTGAFPGRVVVARDRAAADSLLIPVFPRRTVVRLHWDATGDRALIDPLR